ncbi:hypothetical protein SCHPADRAFT_617889 [Schizopora paradoxa]|uniref:Uncharacterized protein n=1 Tax=Schizopora paradoxa TaxID=27342 RepID=A0A0H2RTK6_9AGAM|nr:hypothetical protein SCHPADRAFT_617889 [Schizopora paradoxa]
MQPYNCLVCSIQQCSCLKQWLIKTDVVAPLTQSNRMTSFNGSNASKREHVPQHIEQFLEKNDFAPSLQFNFLNLHKNGRFDVHIVNVGTSLDESRYRKTPNTGSIIVELKYKQENPGLTGQLWANAMSVVERKLAAGRMKLSERNVVTLQEIMLEERRWAPQSFL